MIARVQRAVEKNDRTVLDKIHPLLGLSLHIRGEGTGSDYIQEVLNDLVANEDKQISLEEFRGKLKRNHGKLVEENKGIDDEASANSTTMLSGIPTDDCELHDMYRAFEDSVVMRMTQELQGLQDKDGNAYFEYP